MSPITAGALALVGSAEMTTNPQDLAWSGFGRFLLSLPQRYATQGIKSVGAQVDIERREWLYRPPAGFGAGLVFECLTNDPDLCNVELSIVEAGLSWSSDNGPVSINLSPMSLSRPGFCDRLMTLVTNHGDQLDVWWEVTETWPIVQPSRVVKTLRDLRQAGGKIAVDDIIDADRLEHWLEIFGVPDIVKIDKAVLQDAPAGSLTNLVEIAQRAGSDVVVEGVETENQLAVAESTGAQFWQGYFGGRPELLEGRSSTK